MEVPRALPVELHALQTIIFMTRDSLTLRVLRIDLMGELPVKSWVPLPPVEKD